MIINGNAADCRVSVSWAGEPCRGGNPAGWPRPRARALSTWGERDFGMLPVPWVSRYDPELDTFLGSAFDNTKLTALMTGDLCQVCGGPRGKLTYALQGHQQPDRLRQAGGAVCSLLCARLSAAVCPHYRKLAPVHIWAVRGHRRMIDDIEAMEIVEERLDVRRLQAVLASTVPTL